MKIRRITQNLVLVGSGVIGFYWSSWTLAATAAVVLMIGAALLLGMVNSVFRYQTLKG